MKEIILTDRAPAPIGPYSQAVKINGVLFMSGQIALDPQSGQLLLSSISEETEQVMKNIKSVLNAAGMEFGQVVKTTIFLSKMAYFDEVNAIYAKSFKDAFPARETVEVAGLPKGVNVEISMMAIEG